MNASRSRLLPAALLGGLLLLGAACQNAAHSGPEGSDSDSSGDPKNAIVAKLAEVKAARAKEQRPEDALKSSADLVNRARAATRDFQAISSRSTISPQLERLAADLPQRSADLAARVAVAMEGILRSRRIAWIRDIGYSFVQDQKQIDSWQAVVDAASTRVASDRKRTAELLSFWRRAKELAEASDVPLEIRQQIADVVNEGQRTELAVARPDALIIPLQSTLAEMRELAQSVLSAAERDGPNLLHDATDHDFPIWRAIRDLDQLQHPTETILATISHMLHSGALFVAQSGEQLLLHGLFIVLSLLGLLSLRSREGEWVGDEHEGLVARQTVAHPFAASLLVGMVASDMFYDSVPTVVMLAVYALGMASALVLFPGLLDPRLRRTGYLLGGFMLVDALRLIIIQLVPLERIVLTLELLLASLVLASALRRPRWQASPFSQRWAGFYRAMAWVWLCGLGLGLLAGIFGYGSVAEILGGGMLVSMYAALIVAAACAALGGTVWMLTQSVWLQHLNFIKNYRPRVVSVVSSALRWGGLLFWTSLSLRYLTLEGAGGRLLRRVLNASLAVGALKISLGDLAILGLGGVLAFYTARFVRFLLDEDVLSRLRLSEGARQVASSSVYYALLLLGFFLMLTAVGIQFDKLTVLAGALSVGIGFGLQNVVQNFAAGVILIFGGSLKVRDKIQLGDLMGELRTIGLRASTLQTWQGAEVIVPNSKLIADQVINWTLSDNKRRIEIEIGVEYGSDPERVLLLLREVARSHPKVQAEPPPNALFLNHGESSLDFQMQAWVAFDDFATVRSQLTVLINQRLSAEKIGIPFPQRDLNLATISPDLKQALQALLGKAQQG